MNAADRCRSMLEFERWADRRALGSIKSAERGLRPRASRVGAAPDDINNRYARALDIQLGHESGVK